MREEVTPQRLDLLMNELAQGAPRRDAFRVYFVGGGTAVYSGWRGSSIDVDLYSDDDAVFRNIQQVKERLNMNIEFARPEEFVPPLNGSVNRHLFIRTVGTISFYHYDPYAQCLAKVVRGFQRDVDDARAFVASEMVDPSRLSALVAEIPDAAYAGYPNLSRRGVESALESFVASLPS